MRVHSQEILILPSWSWSSLSAAYSSSQSSRFLLDLDLILSLHSFSFSSPFLCSIEMDGNACLFFSSKSWSCSKNLSLLSIGSWTDAVYQTLTTEWSRSMRVPIRFISFFFNGSELCYSMTPTRCKVTGFQTSPLRKRYWTSFLSVFLFRDSITVVTVGALRSWYWVGLPWY